MKKLMIVVVSIFLVIGMSGCFENPTAPATVYDPTPTATETATPQESVTPEETVTATTSWYITMTGTKTETFILCYRGNDDGLGISSCEEERMLTATAPFVWTSLEITSNSLAVKYHNTTDENLTLAIYKNNSYHGGYSIPPGGQFTQVF